MKSAAQQMADRASDLNDSSLDWAINWCEANAACSQYHSILIAEKKRRAEWRAARAAEEAKRQATLAPLRAAGWKLVR